LRFNGLTKKYGLVWLDLAKKNADLTSDKQGFSQRIGI
jgi:hypothetical protein